MGQVRSLPARVADVKLMLAGLKSGDLADGLPGLARVAREAGDLLDDLLLAVDMHLEAHADAFDRGRKLIVNGFPVRVNPLLPADEFHLETAHDVYLFRVTDHGPLLFEHLTKR